MLTVLALVYTINGLLTWIGRGFGIHQLTLELILGYVFYPVTFFMGACFSLHRVNLQLMTTFEGVPRPEILQVARLLGTKFYANEQVLEHIIYCSRKLILSRFVAYTNLQHIMSSSTPLSHRAFTIASYALCGFANLGMYYGFPSVYL